MAHTVVGLFENESAAQRAAEMLESAGISRSNVDVARGSGNSGSSQQVSNDNDGESGISRFFKGLFGSDSDDAQRYSTVGNNGYSIVTVHAQSDSEASRAADLLDEYGAVNVDEAASQYSGTQQGISSDRTGYTSDDRTDYTSGDRGDTISRVEENLQVGKREVESGGVRVRSRIVSRPVEETLRLREEHVSVNRQEVNRPLTDSDRTAFQDRDIELTERAEVPVVAKEARVVEEISLNKEVSERTETIRDTVRNTEVDIDNIDSTSTRTSGTDTYGTTDRSTL